MKTNYDFPYQFLDLTNEGVRYLETKFDDTELVISIDLGEYEINESIDVILEVEATQTFYRKLFVLSENKSIVKIKYDQLGSKVDYTILLISKQDGEIEINGQSDYYEFGDCVGVLEKNTIAFIEEEEFSGLIKIAPTVNDTIAYDLTSDWITIELPKETYEKFYPWQKDDSTIPFALASLGNSCIQFAIIKALREEGEYKEKKWWETITKLLTDKGYSVDDLGEDDVPGATNKILGNCIQSMVNAATPDVEQGDTSHLS
jgi:hypothetical protein